MQVYAYSCFCHFGDLNVSIFRGKISAARIQANYKREVVLMLLLLLIIMPIKRDGWKFSSLIPYRTLMKLTEGDIQSYYRGVNEVYDIISKDTNEDVFIFRCLFLWMSL